MKKTYPYILFVFVILFFGFNAHAVQAQKSDLSHEILVYIKPDSLELPSNMQSVVALKSLTIHSRGLQKALEAIPFSSIGKAFPNLTDADTIAVRKDGVKIKKPQFSRVFIFHLSPSANIDSAIAKLKRQPSVLFAERQSNMRLDVLPAFYQTSSTMSSGDTKYPEQWFLNNTGQSGGTPGADIDAPEAWQITTGSSSVKIGIIDTGVELA